MLSLSLLQVQLRNRCCPAAAAFVSTTGAFGRQRSVDAGLMPHCAFSTRHRSRWSPALESLDAATTTTTSTATPDRHVFMPGYRSNSGRVPSWLSSATVLMASPNTSGNGYNQGRRASFSSSSSWKVPDSISIPQGELDLSFVRSSGAGGQNVNKVNSQVQVKLRLASCDWIPGEVRDRLREQQANRINQADELVLHVQDSRSQIANRKLAVSRLETLILQAWPRPKKRKMRKGLTKAAKERRMQDKKKRSETKARRRSVDYY